MGRPKGLAVLGAAGRDFQEPAGADLCHPDVLRRLRGPQRPTDVAVMTDLLNQSHDRDLAPTPELAANLTVQCPVVGFHCQQVVGPLLME